MTSDYVVVDIEFVGGPLHHKRIMGRLPCEPHVGTRYTAPTTDRDWPPDVTPDGDELVPVRNAVYVLEPKGARWLAVFEEYEKERPR